jgi:hypothetical protein
MKITFKIFFALFFPFLFFSQEFKTDYLEDYTKIGINLQLTNTFFNNQPNQGVLIEYKNIKSPALGVNYNFLKFKNFKFNINTNVRFYTHNRDFFISIQESGLAFDFGSEGIEYGYLDFLTRLKSDYVFFRKNNLALHVGLGVSMIYYEQDQLLSNGFLSINNRDIYTFDWKTGNTDFYFGGLLSVGVDIATKGMLYQFFVEYNHNFSGPMDIYTYNTVDLVLSPSTTAEKKNTGHYISLGLALHPNKSWFRKKNKTQ